MPSPNRATDHDDDPPPEPSTPCLPSPGNRSGPDAENAPATPVRNESPALKATPKSAPAAAGNRARSSAKKPEPTLLTDFLRGRPSPARLAAERRRRLSVEALKAELRHEMKQSSVRRLQPPGGVRDRVQAWQKANAGAVVHGDPDDLATEPTDLAFGDDDDQESVTEEDRIRIKMRQKKRTPSKPAPLLHEAAADGTATPEPDGTPLDPARPNAPPKKRVVSDDNWRKPKARKASPRRASPKARKSPSPKPKPIPADFVLRSAPNPSVSNKIKAWAAKVDVADAPPPSYRKGHARAISSRSEGAATSDGGYTSSQATAKGSSRPRPADDDGIRVRPMGGKADDATDSGATDAPPAKPKGHGPPRPKYRDEASSRERPRTGSPRSRGAGQARSLPSGRNSSVADHIEVTIEPSDLSQWDRSGCEDDSQLIEVVQEPDSVVDTPTKSSGSKRGPRKMTAKLVHPPDTSPSGPGDEASYLSSGLHQGSDAASSLANKSLADIPGEIPFGHSAFSELDLSLNKTRQKRAKVERNGSGHKTMPSVFKKVMEEGKKIIHEMNEPPRQPVMNSPPSIEKWLNNTVDPFVDAPTTPSATPADRAGRDDGPSPDHAKSRRRTSRENRRSRQSSPQPCDADGKEAKAPPPAERPALTVDTEPASKSAKDAAANGLKRRRATRGPSSPLRSGGRRPFLGVLKEAFTGESTGHTTQPKSYQSHEERKYDGYDDAPSSYHSSDYSSTTSFHNSSRSLDSGSETPRPTGHKSRPPTSGKQELSTIMSEDDSSARVSDLASDSTPSTVTQSTAITRDSEPARPQGHGSGLRRRLTRHSDLVSVLSLPDNASVPSGIKDKRSRPSLRKTRGAVDVTADELLREFVDDENLYLRELKTMVDGVVPVLLSHVLYGTTATELFGCDPSRLDADDLSKSVVNMGIALEKLRHAHRKAPTTDIRRLANWAHGVVPIYNSYLGAWRLGFEDVIVNLAPAAGSSGDDDSLLNALPRDERGDIVNAQGERVAVAHLLKRPLIRVKQMTNFFQCVDAILSTDDTRDLARDFEVLQDKARRRHREETARMTDEDAINTDTARARELRTLEAAAAGPVKIDPSRQVNAKDLFSLSLAHSNGQRLECRVELVHRDRQNRADDGGDLLVREIGDGLRSFLLFTPIAMSAVSARPGRRDSEMVVMVRGSYDGKPWHELLSLSADDRDQIQDWLDILPPSPVPPAHPEPSVGGRSGRPCTPEKRPRDGSAGARTESPVSPKSPLAKDQPTISPEGQRALPSRYRPRASTTSSQPSSPAASSDGEDVDRTPTQKSRDREERSRPLSESMRPDPSTLWVDSRRAAPDPQDDGPPPPPPVHRSPSSSPRSAETSVTALPPPGEVKGSDRLKRRGSSPLKHEYLPSDTSSASGASYSTEDSDTESSDDDIESVDIPETELGVSIKQESSLPAVESVVSASACSLTPSNSASQAGLGSPKSAAEEKTERVTASISRWSDKGAWKDVSAQPCHIIVTAGLVEAYTARKGGNKDDKPLLALDLTPLVLIRQSTALDLEVRSSVQAHCLLHQSHGGGNFRFRCQSAADCFGLYMSVHQARLNNQKFIELENEARFKSFGERRAPAEGEGSSSSRRRSWFGRKNSYRSSVRAPSQSHDGASTAPSSAPSASSFLRRLTQAGNLSFNIARSSVDRQGARRSRGNSIYTARSSSSSGGGTPLRSPSVSVADGPAASPNAESIQMRLHLLVAAAKWEDCGNCSLQIRRPPPGWHQALRADHGLEKRVTATRAPRRDAGDATVLLDAVLGSGCFQPMGSRGIVCGVWEEVRDGAGVVGMVPATGATGGNIKKWCFQFATVADASWVLRLLHQEVVRA
ncbi:hypothetical protein CDD83_8536 [Cordyceps sp. RAO-2017]|nr:hypothetical protein CDD83_8536 [Cordyceps sp. RAO-2017]